MKKRILSLLLCVAMLLTLLPQTVLFVSAATSGTCGTNLSWSYNSSTYTLTITGSGEMTYWGSSSSVPWYSYRGFIKSVSLPDGLTSIGMYAFLNCTGLTSITIPDSVMRIGDDAFYNCTRLTGITIPSGVTSIGSCEFYNCTGLTSITIPDSVTSIGYRAFYNCTGLTSITIPDSVTRIDNSAFEDCTGLTSITIPSGVTSIGDDAFYGCTGLTSITIGNGVTSIGSEAFYGCTGLTSITIPSGVTSIGKRAFYCCTGLTSITIPDSVTSIGEWAFESCTGLTEVRISDIAAWCGISFVDQYANPLCYAKKLYLNDTLITDLVIPSGVTSIGRYAFSGCTGLTSITVAEGNPVYDSRNNCNTIIETATNTLIAGCKNTVIPDSVTSIGELAFWNCTGLTSITIPDSVTSIGSYAFKGCTGLTSITIPSGVTSIGNYAFDSCTGLTSITIGNGVTSIGYRAFCDCTGLTGITIPDSVTSIGGWAFSGCTGLTGITIPDSVTRIYDYAFYNCTGLTSITIPDSVTSIGSEAFKDCTGLTSITIPSGVTSIVTSVFEDCTGLTSITIPDSVTSISYRAFYNCTGLTSITIPDSVTSIYFEAFRGCTGLTDIAILNPNCSIYDSSETLAGRAKTTVYGYPGSTAQTYAKKYGYTFKTLDEFPRELDYWADGSVYSAATGFLTVTVLANQKACESEKIKYVLADTASVLYHEKTYQLEDGVTYEMDHSIPCSSAKIGDGQILIPYTDGSVTVSKDGYVSRTLTKKQLGNGASVYLQKESEDYPVISGLWMKDTDIMNYDYAVDMLDTGTFTVTPEVCWGGSGKGSLRLMQGAHSVSITEKGTDVTWSDQFDVTKTIYIEAIGENGNMTRKALKICAATTIPDCLDGLTVKWGDSISITLPESAGFLAGEKLKVGIPSPVAAKAVIEDGKVYIAIGYYNGASWKKDGQTYKKEVKNWAKDIKDLKEHYSPANFKNFVKERYNKISPTPGSFSFDADFSIVGFGEGYIDMTGKFILLDAGLVVGCEGSVGYSYPFLIAGVVPAFVEAKFKADLEAKMNLYINDSAKQFTPNGEIQFDLSLSGGLGLGVNKVASVSGGINGKLANTWDVNLGETDYYRLVASLNLYAKATLLFLTYRHDFKPITQATWYEYPEPQKRVSASETPELSDFCRIENYELQDISYLRSGSAFLANAPDAKKAAAKGTSVSDTVFLQNAYENSKPQLVSYPDGTALAAWLGYDSSRKGYDTLCLCYSRYDGTNWSAPSIVEDDGTYDGDFTLKLIGNTAYILWQNAEQPIGEEPEFSEVAGQLSMWAGIFDPESGSFRTAAVSAQDGTLEMQPVLCGSGSTAYAVWLNNAGNRVFGDNNQNAILCSCYDGFGWSTVQTLYDGLSSVESLAADYDGTDLNVAWCADTDGDASTAEDLEVWHSGLQITDNEICDSGVSFCSGTLYWYQNGSLISGSELPELTGLETDRYQIIENGGNKVIVYNLYNGLYSTIYARYYDSASAAWGEPIALTDGTDSYNAFSASVDAAGKLTVLANRVAVIGEMTDSEPYGQADIVMLTVTPKTDLAVTDIFYDCSAYTDNADMTFTVSVKNVGETAVHGMMAIITDENGNEFGRTPIPGALLSGEETDIVCGFRPKEIQLGQTVTVNVLPMNVEDEMPENNGIEAMLDFKDISLENTDWGFNAEGQAVIYADVVNRSYAAASEEITVSLREDSEDGTVVDTMVIDSMDALGVERVSFRTQPAEEKVLYITVETQNENENTANDTDFVVLTLPEDFPEEETEDLQIVSAALRLDEDIDILFTAQVPDGYSNPHLTVNGEDITEYTEQDGALLFVYTGIMPQCMGDNISATLYATCDDVEYSDTVAEYSVRTYCVNQLAKTDDATLKTLLSDLLTYGATAQQYMSYKTDALVTDGLALTPTTFEAISGKTVSFTGEQDENTCWTGASLVLSNDLATRFTFVTDSTDGLTVEVSINGRTETFDTFEDAGNGKYFITFDGIMATEFDDTVTAKFIRNGKQLGAAVNYSVNTYICSTQNSESTALQALVRALYNYGASAKAYAAK